MKSQAVYIIIHNLIIQYPKIHRYSLATKIDTNYLNYLNFIFYSSVEKDNRKKVDLLTKANICLDITKFLIDISFSIDCIKENKYFELTEKLNELGRIIGGWKKAIEEK